MTEQISSLLRHASIPLPLSHPPRLREFHQSYLLGHHPCHSDGRPHLFSTLDFSEVLPSLNSLESWKHGYFHCQEYANNEANTAYMYTGHAHVILCVMKASVYVLCRQCICPWTYVGMNTCVCVCTDCVHLVLWCTPLQREPWHWKWETLDAIGLVTTLHPC